MEILQLKYFMHVARTENISHTASIFMVPPSGVSATIKKLENELNVKLFDRTANTLRLNEYGKIFLRALENSENEIRKATIEMLNLNSQPSGEINLLVMTNRRIVTNVISLFRQKYPAVSFNIKHSDHGDNINRSQYDIIISDSDIKNDAFTSWLFVHDEIFLAVHKDNPVSRMSSVNLKHLSGEKFICMPSGTSMGDYAEKLLRENGVKHDVIIECDDPYFIREYVKLGMGVTLYPRVSWGRESEEHIKLVHINDGLHRDSYIYVNKNSGVASKIFAEMLEYHKSQE
ncbi:MAG: LysR family transcriptional regulator [Ruminococcaceae bacterium]|nr:LysR family transcriptional regulator [Oscillospiraceae bacterium]